MIRKKAKNGRSATTRRMPLSVKGHKVPDLEIVVELTVKKTLLELGLDTANPIELQRDFAHLRTWRQSVEEVKRKGFIAAVAIVLSGLLGLLWTAFKTSLR